MKFLIAGFGSIGRRHFRNLLALGERDILFYRTRRSTLPEEELTGFPIEYELEAALAHKPQAVIVANPTALHLDVAVPAAEQGCHLLIEKPVSHSLAGMDELQAALGRGGGKVLVGFQFRFHPGLAKAAALLQSGALGRPVSVQATWGEYLPNWHPWEDYRQSYSARPELGGGVILTLSHPFDYLRWLLGEVVQVWAFAGRLSDMELPVEDVAEVGLKFASGMTGLLHLDYVQRPPVHHLVVVGTGGTLEWDNADGSLRHYRADQGEWEIYSPPPGFERNDLFLAELRHFIEVARGEAEPLCSLADGVQALRLALGALESAGSQTLVQIP